MAELGAKAGENIDINPPSGQTIRWLAANVAKITHAFSSLTALRTVIWPDQNLDLTPGTGDFASSALPNTAELSASATATDPGDHLLTGGVAQTLTLPAVAQNSEVGVSNRSGGDWTIGRTGVDSIEGAAADDTLADGADVVYAWGGTNNWRRLGSLS